MNRLRHLDFDDLFLLRHLLEGNTLASAARQLGLTQPAITQRVRKIERVFGTAMLEKVGRHVRLTADGRALCMKATSALSLMGEDAFAPGTNPLTIVNLGAGIDIAGSWLWPALAIQKRRFHDLTFQCTFSTEENNMRQLEGGSLDAILTASMLPARNFGAIDVGEQPYVMAAAAALAEGINSPADLAQCALLDHSRAQSYLRYAEPLQSTSWQFRDVWYLGSLDLVIAAMVEGFGVAVVPLFAVTRALSLGRIKQILPEQKLGADVYRLIYRRERDFLEPLRGLAASLGHEAAAPGLALPDLPSRSDDIEPSGP